MKVDSTCAQVFVYGCQRTLIVVQAFAVSIKSESLIRALQGCSCMSSTTCLAVLHLCIAITVKLVGHGSHQLCSVFSKHISNRLQRGGAVFGSSISSFWHHKAIGQFTRHILYTIVQQRRACIICGSVTPKCLISD